MNGLEALKKMINKIPQNSVALFHASINYDQKNQGENILDCLINLYFKSIENNKAQVVLRFATFFIILIFSKL